MTRLGLEKQERLIEAVRRGLEGDAALNFIHASGYALTALALAKHLRGMGGRGSIQALLDQGKSNVEILAALFPEDQQVARLRVAPPMQEELWGGEDVSHEPLRIAGLDDSAFETTRLTIRIPNDLNHALTIAARVEGINRNQLVVDILTSALSRVPGPEAFPDDVED